MELQSLRLLAAVARRGSFAAVARDLATDPSTVSRAIAGLEAALGVRLFHRTTRRMVPTEAGDLYLTRVLPLLEELDRAEDEVQTARGDPSGLFRCTCSVAFGQKMVMPLIPELRERFPRVHLELLFDDAQRDLIADRIDLAIRLAPSYRADVVGVKLRATHYHVVASPAYLARYGKPAAPEALADHSCLLFALPDFRSRWLFRERGEEAARDVPVSGSLLASNALALHRAALDGLGIALLADWLIADDLATGALIDLFPGQEVAANSFDTAAWLLYPSRSYLPRKTRAMIDFFKARLAPGASVRSG